MAVRGLTEVRLVAIDLFGKISPVSCSFIPTPNEHNIFIFDYNCQCFCHNHFRILAFIAEKCEPGPSLVLPWYDAIVGCFSKKKNKAPHESVGKVWTHFAFYSFNVLANIVLHVYLLKSNELIQCYMPYSVKPETIVIEVYFLQLKSGTDQRIK